MRKLNSLLSVILFLLYFFSVNTLAGSEQLPILKIEARNACPSGKIEVDLKLENNPGIIAANINISFDEELVLVGAVNGDAFSSLTYIPPKQLSASTPIVSSCNFIWQGFDINDKDIKDGTILTLVFEVSDKARDGQSYSISVSNKRNDVLDKELNSISLSAQGKVNVTSFGSVRLEAKALIIMKEIIKEFVKVLLEKFYFITLTVN